MATSNIVFFHHRAFIIMSKTSGKIYHLDYVVCQKCLRGITPSLFQFVVGYDKVPNALHGTTAIGIHWIEKYDSVPGECRSWIGFTFIYLSFKCIGRKIVLSEIRIASSVGIKFGIAMPFSVIAIPVFLQLLDGFCLFPAPKTAPQC